MRILLTIAYEGTQYAGWQLQSGLQHKPTVQGIIENALATLSGQKIRLYCAGRTDAGVHALAQRAHFESPLKPEAWDWRKRLNAILPPDVRILRADNVANNFHARKSAISKTYCYQFWQEPHWTPPHLRNWVWACGPLNLLKMKAVLPEFAGSHDFASFQNAGTELKTTIREISEIRLEQICPEPLLPSHLPLLRLSITGNGFLKQMVRNIAGYLKAVGSEKPGLPDLKQILAAKNRQSLPTATAPAKGLFLAGINYETGP